MNLLALEADPEQAAIIRHVAHDIVQADVTVVESLDHALQTLHTETPDVILVPALLAPSDEADLRSAVRELPDAHHVEMLTTPRFSRVGAQTAAKPRAWLRWGWHDSPSDRGLSNLDVEDETRLFADRLRWTLQTVRERREPEEDWSVEDVMFASDASGQSSFRGTAPHPVAGSGDDRLVKQTPPGLPSEEAAASRRPVVQPAEPVSPASAPGERPARVPADDERRQQRRVSGPFEGYRHGLLDMPISIRDISEGGCFVNALHDIEVGRKVTLTVEVPGGGVIAVNGLVVHAQPGFGFAVRFVDVADAERRSLAALVSARAAAAQSH